MAETWRIGSNGASSLKSTSVDVLVADTGSIRNGKKNFGWAAARQVLRDPIGRHRNIDEFIAALTEHVRDGEVVTSVGFEFPLFLPIAGHAKDVGAARPSVDHNRAWTAGGGAMILPTGIAQLGYVLRKLQQQVSDLRVTTDPSTFTSRQAGLLVWEAFVSSRDDSIAAEHTDCLAGNSPESHHVCDALRCAEAAATAFRDGAEFTPVTTAKNDHPAGWVNLVDATCRASDVLFDGPREQGLIVKIPKVH